MPTSVAVDGSSLITAATVNAWRSFFPDAVDGVGGGTYVLLPGSTLEFPAGGGVIQFDAQFTFSDGIIPNTGTLTVQAGGVITLQSGATETISAGASINVSGGSVVVSAGGIVDIQTGSFLTADVGSVVTLRGAVGFGAASVTTFLSGSAATFNVGSTSNLNGAVDYGAASVSTYASGSKIEGLPNFFQISGGVNFSAATANTQAIFVTSGGIEVSQNLAAATTDPNFDNALYGNNVIKSWVIVSTDGAGNVTIIDGYNVATITAHNDSATPRFNVTFVRAMATTHYAVFFGGLISGSVAPTGAVLNALPVLATTGFTFQANDMGSGGALLDPVTDAFTIYFQVVGRQ